MDILSLAPSDKRLLAKKVGNDLVKNHGKKRHYTVSEVKAASRRQNFPDTWDCWALSLYSDPLEFAAYHQRTGEKCNYDEMHNSMAEAVATDNNLGNVISSEHSEILDTVHDWSPNHDSSWFDGLLDFFSNVDSGVDFDP